MMHVPTSSSSQLRSSSAAAPSHQQPHHAPCVVAKASSGVRHAPLAPLAQQQQHQQEHKVECRTERRMGSAARQRSGVVCQGTPGLMNLPLDRDLDEPLAGFDSVRKALDDLQAGKFVVVLDDEDRENEGDLIIAADKVTTESMAYMVEHTSGVICISMEGPDLDRLRLPLMVSSAENEEAMYTAFTVTVDLKDGITTGISASDRAKTIRHLATPSAQPSEFRRPGHIFPLRYRPGGVLVRPGHTEAGVDLARLAGCYPAGVLCEIVDRRDGSMARTPQLLQFAQQEGLACVTIADLIRYRLRHERLVVRTATAKLQSPAYGALTVHTYRCALDDSEHVAVVVGAPQQQQPEQQHQGQQQAAGGPGGKGPVPVLVHREAHMQDLQLTGQGNSSAVPSGMHGALQAMAQQGSGVLVYMRPRLEGRPGLAAQLKQLAEAGSSSSAAAGVQPAGQRGEDGMDIRVYGLAAQILRDLGVSSVAALSRDPAQVAALTSCGLQVQAYQPAGGSSSNGAAAHHQGSSNGVAKQALAGAGAGRS